MLKTECKVFFIIIFLNPSFNQQIIDSSCTLEPSGAPGKCMLLTSCKQVRDEVLTLHRLPKTCGFQGTQPIVCCPVAKKPGDISKQKCKEYSSYAYDNSSGGTGKYECEHKITKRIVGGVTVTRKEFPHMAAIGFENTPREIIWRCGGSIISEQYILTAAQCGNSRDNGPPKLVRIGVTSLTDTEHKQDIKISKILQHPDFKPPVKENDIALLKLEKAIELNSYARPACLYLNPQLSVKKAIAIGWGRTDNAGGTTNDLLKVTLDIVDQDFCNMTYKSIIPRQLKKGIREDIHLCAGSSTGKDTCQGDSGGPFQIYHDDSDDVKCMYDIIGLTSFGKACFGDPSVFTRVSHYVEWIENTVWTNLS